MLIASAETASRCDCLLVVVAPEGAKDPVHWAAMIAGLPISYGDGMPLTQLAAGAIWRILLVPEVATLSISGGELAVETIRKFAWQRLYEVAIVETDRSLLIERVAAAQAAVEARVAEIKSARFCTPAEQQALDDARSGLRLLANEVSLSRRAS